MFIQEAERKVEVDAEGGVKVERKVTKDSKPSDVEVETATPTTTTVKTEPKTKTDDSKKKAKTTSK